MSDPVYSGESLLRNWSESASGKRRIILEIEDNGGAHPFKGYEGERFAVVIVGPLAPAEHEIPSPQDKRGVSAGGGVGRDGETRGSPTTPTKPKRRWQDMPASQRAALLLQEDDFDEFARSHPSYAGENCGDAQQWLLMICGVDRKRDITNGNVVDSIYSKYQAWRQARGHGVI